MLSSRAFSNMFHRSGDDQSCFQPGAKFRRLHPSALVETAEVLAVSTDNAGIPHVRFSVRYDHPARPQSDVAQRMLALKSFADRYRD